MINLANQFISIILALLPNNCHAMYIIVPIFFDTIHFVLKHYFVIKQKHRQQNNLTLKDNCFLTFLVQYTLVVVLYIVGGQCMSPVIQTIQSQQ